MTSANPIAGNDSFTKVANLAGQLSDLSVGEVTALNVKSLVAESVSSSLGPQVTQVTVLGYAPSDFGTNAVGTAPLNTQPGQARATDSSDINLLTLPEAATVTAVELSNNGTTITSAGAPTFDLSVGAFDTAGTNLLAAVALADAEVGTPSIPVISNFLATPAEGADGIRDSLSGYQ